MKKTTEPDDNELSLFRDEFSDVRPIKQDKIPPQSATINKKSLFRVKKTKDASQYRQSQATFEFSDGFEAYFDPKGPLKYVRAGTDSHQIKRLRRGEYPPDLILDLHGMKKQDAKLEVAALINAAQKQHVHVVCIVHGVGTHVLKKSVPNWLIQHPAIIGFHQAPLEWGGNGALLALIEQSDPINSVKD